MINLLLRFIEILNSFLFFEFFGFPIIILLMLSSGIYFSLKLNFPAWKMFKKSLAILTNNNKDKTENKGLLNSTQSLFTSLSSIIGMGNVGGVAMAIIIGGPGSLFWMVLIAFVNMNLSFAEILLASKYNKINMKEKTVECAPINYIKKSLKELNFVKLGIILSVIYAIFYSIGLIGTTIYQLTETVNVITDFKIFLEYDTFITISLALAIIYIASKNIVKISNFMNKIMPVLSGLYIICGLFVIINNFNKLPLVFFTIVKDAFSLNSVAGGILLTMSTGIKRGIFSNESGLGSTTTTYTALNNDNLVKSACLGSLNPFFDTVIICFFTGLIILSSGVYEIGGNNLTGILLVKEAFNTVFSGFDIILAIFIIMLCFTMPVSSIFNANNIFKAYLNKKYFFIIYIVEFFLLISSMYLNVEEALTIADTLYLSISIPNVICLFLNRNNIKNIFFEEMKK